MIALSRSVTLERRLRHLVDLRVSQINGCAFCLDMHAREARRDGETAQRLDTLAGWRESPFFTARERAALALAEAIARVADVGHVSDAVHDEAARHFDEAELAQLIFAITVINALNRMVVAAQTTVAAR